MEAPNELGAIIISEHSLVREGMKAVLANSRFKIRHELNSVELAVDLADAQAMLIFVGSRLDDHISEPLKSLRIAYPESLSRIVFYAQWVQLSPDKLFEVFGADLDGCLMSDASVQALQRSLDLIMMGERVFPYSLLANGRPHKADSNGGSHGKGGQIFSAREGRVLNFLGEGRPNKFIARELRLSEAMVKIHVRTLLGKIGCTNRTQAAVWVTKHGLIWRGSENGLEASDTKGPAMLAR